MAKWRSEFGSGNLLPDHVRFTPESGHSARGKVCPLGAKADIRFWSEMKETANEGGLLISQSFG